MLQDTQTKVFLSISSINAMWKNEHLSPIPKHFTKDLSAQGVKYFKRMEILTFLPFWPHIYHTDNTNQGTLHVDESLG